MSGGEKPSKLVFARTRSLQPGQVLAGRYKIVRLLGHGGMGEVYEAEDTVLGMHVALKTIRGESNEVSVRRFQREVVLARSVAHTNICRVFDFGADESVGAFYTMELLRGRTLAELLKEHSPLPLREAKWIAAAVAHGLEAAHSLGIVHRDLKPANIFITEDRRVVVTDFGLARSSGAQSPGHDQTAVAYSATAGLDGAVSHVAGTPAYMAPEQLSGGESCVATDVYALGMVMYEMSTGRLPWADGGMARFSATPEPPRIEPRWDALVLRCLSATPGRRFASAADLRVAILGQRAAVSPRTWLVGSAVLAAALSGILFFTSKRSWTPRPEAMSWYERGLSSLHDGDYNSAAKQFQMAAEADRNFAMAQARLAEAWAEQDYSDRAREAMLQASTIAAKYPVAARTDESRLLAIQMMVARDLEGSLERYRRIADNEGTPDTLFDCARAFERNSQTAQAIAKYREAIAKKESYPASWARLGYLLARGGKFGEAAAAFDKAGMLYRATGNLAGVAEVDLRRAQVLMQQGQLNEAQKILDSALKLAEATGFESQRIRMLLRRGALARLRENSAEAEQYASEALSLAGENRMEQYTVEGLLDLGNVYLQKLDLDNAEKYYSNALRTARSLNSRYHEARAAASLASVRSQQGRLDDARAGAEKALAFFRSAGYYNETVAVLTLLAQVRSQSGDSKGALSAFEEQLRLTSAQNPRALAALHLRIGIVLCSLERYPEALTHLQAAMSAPDATTRAYAAINRAEILTATGDFGGARALLGDTASLVEPTGIALQRATVVRVAIFLAEENYKDAARSGVEALGRSAAMEPSLATRLRSLQAIAFARTGAPDRAEKLCREAVPRDDLKAAAAAELNCAEAELSARNPASARKRAAEARVALERLDQPEAQWRACIVEALAVSPERAALLLPQCETIQKIAADRWGTELWGRYLTRADVRTRLSRLRRLAEGRL